jgi:spore maturation protein CgeB
MGHQVIRYEPGIKIKTGGSVPAKKWMQVKSTLHELSKQSRVIQSRARSRLLSVAKTQAVGLTIVCHDFLHPFEVKLLKEATKSPVALWFPDAISNFHRTFFLNAPYDALFFKDPYIVHRLNQTLSARVYYLPECCNPRYHKSCDLLPHDREIYGCEIAAAGNLYPYRAAFFRQLSEYEVKIWGNPPPLWMDVRAIEPMLQRKYVANEEKSKAFRAAKIVVNNLHPAEVWGINARAFEIAGAGGFQLVDWRPALGQLFRDSEEVVTFSDMKDLKEKLEYYLPSEETRFKIARRAQERAHREHTYEKRLTLLLETVFNSARGFPLPEVSHNDGRELERV